MLRLDLTALSETGKLPIRASVPADPAWWAGAAFEMAGPAKLSGLAQWLAGEEILVEASLEGARSGRCRRCADPMEAEFRIPLTLYYVPEGAGEVDSADVRTYDPSALSLDLSEAVREEAILTLSRYLLCSQECRGLCPHCGVDLNQKECVCAPEEGDARWNVLKALRAE